MSTKKEQTFYLPLEDVNNEHCALIIDKVLGQIPEILHHQVELNNQRALVSVIDTETIYKAIKAIKEVGYGVTTVKQTFPILNLSCASCAVSSQTMMQSIEGVLDASVNYGTTTLTVEYLPNMTNPLEFQKKLQSISYDIIVDKDSKTQETLEAIQEKKYKKLKQKVFWSILLSAPVVVIGMFFMDMPYANPIMWLLSTPVVLWFGQDFFINMWKQTKNGMANMDTLVALSTGIAYVFSLFNMLFPQVWESKGLESHVYFEAATVIIAFILLGKLLEEKAKGHTSASIKKLMGLKPKTVVLILPNGTEKTIDIEDVQKGDTILVKPGEKIAVDGKVVSGNSYVDESMLSGEPIPILKEIQDKVFAGTINQKGSFHYEAVSVGKETRLAHIIKMVQDAQGSKAPVQKLVDKIAGIFVPTVIGISILTFVLWYFLGDENGTLHGILAAITVLIIACPCALGLATPTAIMVGIGKGAENGILIKDAESLEKIKKVNAIVLDKTGTITEGKPEITNIKWAKNDEILKQILFSIEKKSEHPLAEAVVNYFEKTESVNLSFFESITGKGTKAEFNNETYYVGNKKLITEHNISVDNELQKHADEWIKESKTVIWLMDSKQALCVIALTDKIKQSSIKAINDLKQMNIELYMLTGDNAGTASAIANQIGIGHYKAEASPQDKVDFIKELQKQEKIVAMVGDGINDSAALAHADISIAMDKGSDIAMDVAKITIVSSDLTKIPQAIQLSKKTVQTIKQNLFWAFIYNLMGIPIAAGILYSSTGFMLNPMIAGAAMTFSSLSVVSNSLRLKWK